jgi:CRISPR/Cas system-associated protein Csm6
MSRLRVDAAKAQAAIEAATLRAEVADRQLDETREKLQAERSRHDLRLSELHEQLAQLVARTPPRRSAAKTPTRKKPATAS